VKFLFGEFSPVSVAASGLTTLGIAVIVLEMLGKQKTKLCPRWQAQSRMDRKSAAQSKG